MIQVSRPRIEVSRLRSMAVIAFGGGGGGKEMGSRCLENCRGGMRNVSGRREIRSQSMECR